MRYRLLALLCLVAMIAYIQRAAISVPLARIAADFKVVDVARDMGWVQSAWYFGYALMQLPSGWLADRWGSRLAIAIFCAAWSMFTVVTATAQDYYSLMTFWALMGAAQAGIFPCSAKAIGQTFPELERARASGLLACGMAIGGALAPLLTGALLQYPQPWPVVWDWRVCLGLYGLLGLLWVPLFLNLVPEGAMDGHATAVKTVRVDWTRLVTSPSLALLCSQQFLRAAGMVFFLTWFPTYLQKARGVTTLESGLLTFYAGMGGVLGSLLGGFASDALLARTGNRRLSRQGIAVAGMACCSALIVASFFIADTHWAMAAIGLGAFCATFGGVSGYTVAIEFGGKHVGTVFSTMNMCGNIGAMLFPITAGWLVATTNNWNLALFLFAVIMAIDAVCWALLNPQGTLFGDKDASR
jgi:MFS family permease